MYIYIHTYIYIYMYILQIINCIYCQKLYQKHLHLKLYFDSSLVQRHLFLLLQLKTQCFIQCKNTWGITYYFLFFFVSERRNHLLSFYFPKTFRLSLEKAPKITPFLQKILEKYKKSTNVNLNKITQLFYFRSQSS